jgi:hypothetical protein
MVERLQTFHSDMCGGWALRGLEGIQAHVLDVTSDDSVARCLEEVGLVG